MFQKKQIMKKWNNLFFGGVFTEKMQIKKASNLLIFIQIGN